MIGKEKAQGTLELTITLIAVVLLLMGITRVFIWLNSTMIDRHRNYTNTRTNYDSVDFYEPVPLNAAGGRSAGNQP